MSRPALVAGIGNIFHRDDAFGVEVAARLGRAPKIDGVRVEDFGIRGFDLVLALLDGYDPVVLVDAVSRGGAPGTLYLMEVKPDEMAEAEPGFAGNAHRLDPQAVLATAGSLGAVFGRVYVVGCEPATLQGDSGEIGLSEPVLGAVEPAMEMIRSLLQEPCTDGNTQGGKVSAR